MATIRYLRIFIIDTIISGGVRLPAKIGIVALCIAWAGAAYSQSIRGRVITSSGGPVGAVEVHNSRTGQVALTDTDGQYVVPNTRYPVDLLLINDNYHLHIETIDRQPTAALDPIIMRPLEVALNEVVIQERRKIIYNLRQLRDVEGTAIYAGKKTEVVLLDNTLGNLAANNPRQIYAQIAGLNIYEGGDAGLQLNIGGRGLDPNRTANFNTRQNGYDISADVLGYPESYYTPPAEALSEIQIIRGAASLQYGTQFGGLVNFRLRPPPINKEVEITSRQTMGSFGLLNSFNRVAGTKGKLSYQAYGHFKGGNGWRPNSSFRSRHALAQVGYQITPSTKVTGEITYLHYLAQQAGGLTDAQFYDDPNFSNRARNFFEVDWLLYQVLLEHRIADHTHMSLSFFGLDAQRSALGFRTNRVSQLDDNTLPRDLIRGDFRNVGAEARYLRQYQLWGHRATTLVGAKVYRSANESRQGAGAAGDEVDFTFADDLFPNYPAQSDFDFPNRNIALFAEQIIAPTEQITITPGVRLEHIVTESSGTFRRIDFDLAGNPIRDRTFRDDRTLRRTFALLGIGLAYRPAASTEIYANVSQNYRSVTFNDIRVANPTFQVDPDISDESGYTMDLGARGTWRGMVSYDAGVYGLVYDDRIGEALRRELIIDANGIEQESGRIVRTRGNIGRAVIVGLESYVEWQIHRAISDGPLPYVLSVFTNMALTTSRYTDSDIAGVVDNAVEFIPAYNIKAGIKAGYRNLLAQLQYTSIGEQYTDASNAPQDINDNQSGIKGSIPAYQVWDLSVSYKSGRWTLESGINNMLNESYFTRRATGYPGPGILPSDPRSIYFTIGITM